MTGRENNDMMKRLMRRQPPWYYRLRKAQEYISMLSNVSKTETSKNNEMYTINDNTHNGEMFNTPLPLTKLFVTYLKVPKAH